MKYLVLVALTALPMAAFAANSTPDMHFYKSLAAGGLAEVRDGQLAQDKGADQKIKDFGAMMVKDHSAANQELMALAQSKGVTLPTSPAMTAHSTKMQLDALSGATFDKAYVKGQIKAHKGTVALLQKEIASGQDAQARAFAQKVLPTVQSHLEAIEGIGSGMGIKR